MIPQEALDLLRSDPSPQAQTEFEAVFGPGSAAQALQPAQPVAPAVAPQAQPVAAPQETGGVLSDIATGLSGGVQRVARGVGNALNETARAVDPIAQRLNAILPEVFSTEVGPIPVPAEPDKSVTGSLIESASQFVTGWVGAGRWLKLFGVGKAATTTGAVARGMAQGAIADATVFDPNAARLANWIDNQAGVRIPVIDYLAAKDDDSEAEGRFKNALEGALLGGAVDVVFHAVRGFRAKARGNLPEAVKAAEDTEKALAPKPEPVRAADTPAPLVGEGPQTVAIPFDRDTMDDFVRGVTGRSTTLEALESGLERKRGSLNLSKHAYDLDAKAMFVQAEHAIGEAQQRVWSGGDAHGVQSVESVRKIADDIANTAGTDVDSYLAHMAGEAAEYPQMAQKVLAHKMVMDNLAHEVQAVTDLYRSGGSLPGMTRSATGETLQALYANFVDAVTMGRAQATNHARALRIMRENHGPSTSLRTVAEDGSTKIMSPDELAERIALTRDATGKIDKKALRGVAEKSFVEKAADVHNEYWINSILSGLPTQVVNVTSNAVHLGIRPAERWLAGAISGDKSMRTSAMREYIGMYKGFVDSARMTYRVLRNGDPILDTRAGTIEQNTKAISSQGLGVSGTFGTMVDLLGTAVRLPTRMLATSDEFFKQIAYRSRVYADAWADAAAKAEAKGIDLDKSAADTIARKAVQEAFDPDTGSAFRETNMKPINREALQSARETVFGEDLAQGSFMQKLQMAAASHPWLRVVVPFVRTPANIVKFVGHRTPGINFALRQYQDDILAGGERAASAKAKMVTGTMAWSTGIMLAQNGLITGGGPRNPDMQASWRATGWQPYSIAYTGEDGKTNYVGFNRADPFGMFLGIAADISEVGGHIGEDDLSDVAASFSVALMKNLSSKTYLKGLYETLDVVAGARTDEDWKTTFNRWVQRQAGSYVPSGLRPLTNEDGLMREAHTVLDAIKARTPGYSDTVDRRYNVLGERVTTPSAWGPDWLSPFASSTLKDNAAATEMARLADVNERGFRPPPKKYKGQQGAPDLTTFSSSNGFTAYDRYQELIGSTPAPAGAFKGKTLQEALSSFVQTDKYKRLSDGSEEIDGGKVQAVQAIISAYRDTSMKTLRKENPELNTAVLNFERTKAQARRSAPREPALQQQ